LFSGEVIAVEGSYYKIHIIKTDNRAFKVGTTTHVHKCKSSLLRNWQPSENTFHLSCGQAIHFKGAMTEYQAVVVGVHQNHYEAVLLKVFKSVHLQEMEEVKIPRNSPNITAIPMPDGFSVYTMSKDDTTWYKEDQKKPVNATLSAQVVKLMNLKQTHDNEKIWEQEYLEAYKANMFELYWLTKDKTCLAMNKGR